MDKLVRIVSNTSSCYRINL